MSVTFTESIRSLIEQGGDPDPETFGALWESLRGALVFELRKRGLFTSPPSFLGIYGAVDWLQGDALEELLAECFSFAVLRRLERLGHHLKVKSNIDGLIFANIRNFLFETQKRHDRVGFKVFKALHQATRQSIAAGVLHVLEGNPKIRNDTVLGFSSGGNPGRAHGAALSEQVEDWGNDLLPDLLTARGKKREAMLGRLRSHLERLRDQGVEVFRFKTLIQPLQSDVRERWHAMGSPGRGEFAVEESDDEGVRLVRLVRPEAGVEERDSFRKLVTCVGDSLDQLDTKRKTKDYLRKLWDFLQVYSAEDSDDKLPANQQLAKKLAIPRERFPGLYAKLASLVAKCQSSSSGQSSVIRQGGASLAGGAAGEATAMTQISHQERLRKEMGQALSRLAEQRAAASSRGDQPPRLGEVFLFVATAGFPVEWAVVERAPEEPGFFRVVPTDAQPLVGSADVEVPARALRGPMNVRCGFEVRLAAEAFDPELCVGSLESEDLDRVRRKRDELARGRLRATENELEVDGDPDYRDWRREVLRRAQAALADETGAAAEEPGGRVIAFPDRLWRSRAIPYAAAASILVALGLGLVSQRRQIADLRQRLAASGSETPLAGLPLAWFTTQSGVRGERTSITLSSTASHVLLLVDVNDPEPYPAYRLEIGEPETELHWSSGELPRVGVDEVSAVLPRRLLPAGEYPFRIYGVREGQAELVAKHTLQVEIE